MPGGQRAPPVRVVAGQLSSMLREHNFVRAYAFPDLDSLLASSILLEALRRHNVDVEVVVQPLPPERVDEPSILLGYPVELVEAVGAASRAVAIARGRMPSGLTKLPTVAHEASSVSGLTVSVLAEIMVVTELAPLALAAAYWRGLDRGKRAEFEGIEASFVELLTKEGVVEGELTLRLFRWFSAPVELSLEITVDPYVPGLTGSREAVRRLLEGDPRLRKLLGVSVREAEEEPITALAASLYEELKRASLAPRRPSEVIGYAYYAPKLPVSDLRELAYLLAALGEDEAAFVVATAVSPGQVLGYAHYRYYSRGFASIVEALEELARGGRRQPSRLGRLRVADLGEVDHLLPVERQARLLGVVPADAAAAARKGGGLVASMESLLSVLGGRGLLDAIKAGCVSYRVGTLLGAIDEARCKSM